MQTQSSANMDKEVLDTRYGLMLRKSIKPPQRKNLHKMKQILYKKRRFPPYKLMVSNRVPIGKPSFFAVSMTV